jgi:hypothetical protein
MDRALRAVVLERSLPGVRGALDYGAEGFFDEQPFEPEGFEEYVARPTHGASACLSSCAVKSRPCSIFHETARDAAQRNTRTAESFALR